MNKLYFTYLKNLVKILFLKLRYRDKLGVDILQCLGPRFKIQISPGGHIKLGEKTENRDTLYLLAAGGSIEIGKHCFFNTNCCITSVKRVKIGDNCKIGNNVVILDHDHNYRDKCGPEFIAEDVVIGNRVWIGANVVILRGSNIGDDSVIAAGSVVKGNVDSNTLYLDRHNSRRIK